MEKGKEKIKRRIAALLQMTRERGCTEAEAMVAASKAAELMRDYGLSDADIEMSEGGIEVKTGLGSVRAVLWEIIAHCTNTSLLWTKNKEAEVIFYGYAPGPEIATYLMRVCDRAINHEIAKFKQSRFYRQRRTLATKRQAVGDFTAGLVYRLKLKLHELFAQSMSKQEQEVAYAYMKQQHAGARDAVQRVREIHFERAVGHRYDAGSNVQLAHGMGGKMASLRIGKQEAVAAVKPQQGMQG